MGIHFLQYYTPHGHRPLGFHQGVSELLGRLVDPLLLLFVHKACAPCFLALCVAEHFTRPLGRSATPRRPFSFPVIFTSCREGSFSETRCSNIAPPPSS